jgi:predicted permease
VSESVVLACGGGAVGAALAFGLKQFVGTMLIPQIATSPDLVIPMDTRVLAATLCVSMVSALLAGLLPAILGARAGSASFLGHPGNRVVTGARRLRAGLAGLQLALSLALVTGALMFVATMRNLSALDLGFDPTGVTAHRLDAIRHRYSPDQRLRYYLEVFERLRGIPEWTGPALSATLWGSNRELAVGPSLGPEAPVSRVRANAVTTAYFDVLGIRITQGRGFTEDETLSLPPASPTVVVVSEALARHVYGRPDVVNRQLVLRPRSKATARPFTIVGVTEDARWSVTGDPLLEFFFPLTSPDYENSVVNVLVKSTQPLRSVSQRVETAAMAVDPTLPVQFSVPFSIELENRLRERTTLFWVLSMLGWLGLTLAAVGLAGILAQLVAERTKEFGIRIAVGSGRARIFGLVLKQAAWIGGIGTVAGLGLAYWGSRFIEAQLYGVTRTSPGAYVTAAAALGAVVFLAGLWPARTATRIQPVNALRAE